MIGIRVLVIDGSSYGSTKVLGEGFIRNHLASHSGSKDLREIRESELVEFISKLQAKGRAPSTNENGPRFLRMV